MRSAKALLAGFALGLCWLVISVLLKQHPSMADAFILLLLGWHWSSEHMFKEAPHGD